MRVLVRPDILPTPRGRHRYEKVMGVRKNLKVKVTFSSYLKERSFPVLQELIEEIARADYAAEMKEWDIRISDDLKAQILSLLRPSLEQYVRNER